LDTEEVCPFLLVFVVVLTCSFFIMHHFTSCFLGSLEITFSTNAIHFFIFTIHAFSPFGGGLDSKMAQWCAAALAVLHSLTVCQNTCKPYNCHIKALCHPHY
jgi:hypothetical protein